MTEKIQTVTKEQIQADKERRRKECVDAIGAILQQYDCQLVAMPQYTQDGRTVCAIDVVAK